MPELNKTTMERPPLERAARLLSREIPGLIGTDHRAGKLIVSLMKAAPPKNWMGWPVEWRRS